MRQAIIIFLMFVHTSSMRLIPTYAASKGERAGWLTPILAILPFLCLLYIIQALFKNDKNSNLSLSDIIFKTFGRFFGTVLLILYLIWMMISLGLYVRYFAERLLSTMLPNTPLNFFIITILIVVFYCLRGGFVYVIRTVEFLFLTFSIVLISLFLFTLPNIKVTNLFPVTHYDIWPIIKGSYSIISIWSTFTFTFFFGDKINDKEHIKRFGLQATAYLVITTLMILIQTIGVYGYSVISRVFMPYIFVIKSISILISIERLESIIIASWVIVDFATISLYIYIVISIIKSLFSLEETKSLISPVIIFAFIFSQYFAKNRFELERFSNYISLPLNIIFGFFVPLFILIVGKLRKQI